MKDGRPKKLDSYLQSIEEGDTYWAPEARKLAEEGGLDVGKIEKALEKWAGVVKQRELMYLEERLNEIKEGGYCPSWLSEDTKKLAEKYNIDQVVVDEAMQEGAKKRDERRLVEYGSRQ